MSKLSVIADEERAAIAKHAFDAGYMALFGGDESHPEWTEKQAAHRAAAWASYEPEENMQPDDPPG